MTSADQINILDLNPFYGLIAVSGPDAQNFLQGQLTLDIREITPTNPGFSAYCNPKGRVRALFRIFYSQNTYFLQLPIGVLPSALATLKKVARFSKVTLEDVSNQWHKIGVWLPSIDGLEINHQINHLLSHHADIIILPLPSVDTIKRFELIGSKSTIENRWQYLIEKSKIADFNDWKLLDIQAGIPEIWPETIEQFLPHTLNLPALGAVSFNKGCYCGQEIVARMEYRSDIKHRLFNIKLDNIQIIPSPGSEVKNNYNEILGIVVTHSPSEILGVKSKT